MVGLCQRPSAISVWIQEMNVGAQWRKKTNNTYTHHYGIRFGMRFEAIKNDEQRNIQTWTQALTIAALHTQYRLHKQQRITHAYLFRSASKTFTWNVVSFWKTSWKRKRSRQLYEKLIYSSWYASLTHSLMQSYFTQPQIMRSTPHKSRWEKKKLYNRVSFTLHHRSIEHLFRTWINLKKVYWHWMLQPMHATSFPCGLIECSIGVRSKEMSYAINESAIGMCIYRLLLLIDRLPHIRVHFGVWFS